MRRFRYLKPFVFVVLVGVSAGAAFIMRERWLPLFERHSEQKTERPSASDSTTITKVLLSDQAIANLNLVAKPVQPQTWWKSTTIPGMIVDRPGRSDRGVVAPATGVITAILHVPGESVKPGQALFTLKLFSESLHLTQTELFKATQDRQLSVMKLARLEEARGTVPAVQITEVENQITRLDTVIRAYRQELQVRSLTTEQIDGITAGKFITEIPINVPPRQTGDTSDSPLEVQELKVELGQQVQAGQTLGIVANHEWLTIEGRAFSDETPLLERSVNEHWPVEVDFQENPAAAWSSMSREFQIQHLANTIDPMLRTFAFQLPLSNQSRTVESQGRSQMLWRFRPGQKVRLHVRVEKLENVFVLPSDAVTRDGPEVFLFTQNVNTFERKSVRVLAEDQQQVVIANDGMLVPGTFVVQSAAAQLNRMAKAASNSVPKGYHVHADGSLHKNEDEGK
ncbi:efflux RND transporter periplasmic adaptor subunit [soil metagenome]